ncbi:hypothetical protein M9Y10_022788 [Tritrichomonas musculus]|uniref:Protein kinase domain-containing protein n=1 Tax=Tritrichomonas musculus TaxID=1915356 RepID=A0ABR2KTC7_9EUKA
MKKGTDSLEEEELQTKDFTDQAVAPEINKTYKSDVYSLGYIIHFILYGKPPKKDDDNDEMVTNEDFIFKSSLNLDPTKRPNIFEMMNIFYSTFLSEIILEYQKHHLLSLAIQKDPQTQFNLGFIYQEGRYVVRDINKAMHYYSLAADQNYQKAQCVLAIHYYTLAANQNFPKAQFELGLLYYTGEKKKQDIKKATYYIILASNNNFKDAYYFHAFLLHEGIFVKKDIQQAIHYYKEASSFNNQYSKNNLGIIYKHEGNVGKAIVYFEEAIRQENDYLSMYNLSHIYIYIIDTTNKQEYLDKSIKLLIQLMNKFEPSFTLLQIAFLLRFDLNIEQIKQELVQRTDLTIYSINKLLDGIDQALLDFDILYETFQSKDYLYNFLMRPILSSEIGKQNVSPPKYPKAKDLSSEFYKGFGDDLYSESLK